MPDIVDLQSKFYSVQNSEGYSLLLSMVGMRRDEALRELEMCSPEDLTLAQSRFRAWDEVARALGTTDGGGIIQELLESKLDSKKAKPMPGLRVPGNR